MADVVQADDKAKLAIHVGQSTFVEQNDVDGAQYWPSQQKSAKIGTLYSCWL